MFSFKTSNLHFFYKFLIVKENNLEEKTQNLASLEFSPKKDVEQLFQKKLCT